MYHAQSSNFDFTDGCTKILFYHFFIKSDVFLAKRERSSKLNHLLHNYNIHFIEKHFM